MSSPNDRFDKLQRALAVFVAHREQPDGRSDEQLLAAHPELHEPLAMMLRGDADDAAHEPAATSTPRRVEAGTRLGDYQLEHELGRGGMGTVFAARQTSLGRRVAIKVLHDRLAAAPAAVERFRREARAAAGLRHPGILPIFEVGEHDGVHFFSMERIEGPSLDAASRDGSLGAPGSRARRRRAVELVVAVADALGHAHAHGVVHLDVKPHNVLLAADGAVKLVDFGLARDLSWDDGDARRGGVVGTPQFMSPEQARGEAQVGAPADVYACGLLLCELACGRRVVAAGSLTDVLAQVAAAPDGAPAGLARELPRSLRAIVDRCLAHAPQDRYRDGDELAGELRAWLQHEPVAAARAGPLLRAALWARRHPLRVGALVALAFVATLLLWQRGRHEDRVADVRREGRARQAAADAAVVDALAQLVDVLDDQLARQVQLAPDHREQLAAAAALCVSQLERPGVSRAFRERVAVELLEAADVHRRVGDPRAARPLVDTALRHAADLELVAARARSTLASLALALREADAGVACDAAEQSWRPLLARARAAGDAALVTMASGALLRLAVMRVRDALDAAGGEQRIDELVAIAAELVPACEPVDRVRYLLEVGGVALRRERWQPALDTFAAAGELLDDGVTGVEFEGLRHRQLVGTAAAIWRLRRHDDAEVAFAAARSAARQFAARFPSDLDGQRSLATLGMQEGQWLLVRGRPEAAAVPLREALPIWRRLSQDGDASTSRRDREALAVTLGQLANCQLLQRPPVPAAARPLLEEAIAVQQQLASEAPDVLSHFTELGGSHSNLAAWHNSYGEAADALAHAEAAIAAQLRAFAVRPEHPRVRRFLTMHCSQAAFAHERLGDVEAALAAAQRAMDYDALHVASVRMCVEVALRCVSCVAAERGDAIAATAVGWLRALAAGNAAGLATWIDSDRLAPLRERADFRALRQELGR